MRLALALTFLLTAVSAACPAADYETMVGPQPKQESFEISSLTFAIN